MESDEGTCADPGSGSFILPLERGMEQQKPRQGPGRDPDLGVAPDLGDTVQDAARRLLLRKQSFS